MLHVSTLDVALQNHTRVGWKVHRLTMMQWSNLWFISQHSVLCGPHTSSISVAALGFLWYRSSHPDPRKSPQLRYDLIIGPILLPSQVYVHVGERKIIRWCQIRTIWRVINQFKATVMHSSHCNHRHVCKRIVLVKQDSLCQFPITTFQSPELANVGLSGRKQCS